MYLHRPDLLSLSLGLAFLLISTITLLVGWDGLDVLLVPGILVGAAAVGTIGRLLTGDVHRAVADARSSDVLPPGPYAHHLGHDVHHVAGVGAPGPGSLGLGGPPPDEPVLVDPIFDDLPIDPDELDRRFRERFGDDDLTAGTGGGAAEAHDEDPGRSTA